MIAPGSESSYHLIHCLKNQFLPLASLRFVDLKAVLVRVQRLLRIIITIIIVIIIIPDVSI